MRPRAVHRSLPICHLSAISRGADNRSGSVPWTVPSGVKVKPCSLILYIQTLCPLCFFVTVKPQRELCLGFQTSTTLLASPSTDTGFYQSS